MAKPKISHKLSSKLSKKQAAVSQTADDFQEQADAEEDRGGKWRAGDISKSARAFQRALAIYDQGLQRFPGDFDLAYNKARLALEVSQQQALLPHFGLSTSQFLQETLSAHRVALALNDGDANLLFNTAQVLTSLAEDNVEESNTDVAITQLHEALELLSSCLARQEILLEQQNAEIPDDDDEGGVALENEEAMDSNDEATTEETATVIEPLTPSDLLDTVHASLSALTTLVQSEQESALDSLEAMSQTLLGTKTPAYLALLPAEEQDPARIAVELDRATFACALADARYTNHTLDLQKYAETFSLFEMNGKSQDAKILSAEGEARAEFVLSVLDELRYDQNLPVMDCWRQLGLVQDVLSTATKLTDEDAQEMRPDLFKRKANVELLRFRLASLKGVPLPDSIRKSSPTLLKNAQTYYKGAMKLGASTTNHEPDLADRLKAVEFLISVQNGAPQPLTSEIEYIFAALLNEGLIDSDFETGLSGESAA